MDRLARHEEMGTEYQNDEVKADRFRGLLTSASLSRWEEYEEMR
jgi:hypothetical protein